MSLEDRGGASWRRWAVVALGAGLVVFGYTLCRRGIILSDEGYLLLQAYDLSQGKVLYRDMDAFVAPGVWFLLAGLFKLFEPSILVSRMAALVCYLGTFAVSARIVNGLAGTRHALGCVAVLAIASVWAFPAWTWSFYSPYAVFFALLALERLLAWRARGRGSDLVWVGVCLGLCITFKQNYGAQALVGAALGFAAIVVESRRGATGAGRGVAGALPAPGLRVALGLLAVGLPVLGYFALHGAVSHAFHALVVSPFGGFLGQHDIPYLPLSEFFERDLLRDMGRLTYGSYGLSHTALRYDWPKPLVRGIELLHVLLYWIPPLVFGAAAVLCLRSFRERFDGGLAAVLAVAGLLFLGVFPRADFHHLVQVYQPVVVLGAVVGSRLAALRGAWPPWLRRFGPRAAGGLLAVYAAIAVYWYADILGSLSEEVEQPRGGVLVSLERRQMIDFEVGKIRENSKPGEPVLSLPGLSMLNFLAERPMPGRYYNLYAVHIAHDQGAGVVRGMEEARVRLVLSDYDDFFSEVVGLRQYAPKLADHLRRYFKPVALVALDEHLFLLRRPAPLPRRQLVNVLGDCDVASFDWHDRSIREHLLFDTLYHPLQSGEGVLRRQVDTLCRVSVPEGSLLAFALGYRQPISVEDGTELVAELWIRPLDGGEGPLARVFRERIHPEALFAWESPPPEEFRVDLSRWGGQRVLLMFRTVYAGNVEISDLDLKGFAMVWQDPQLEYGGDAG